MACLRPITKRFSVCESLSSRPVEDSLKEIALTFHPAALGLAWLTRIIASANGAMPSCLHYSCILQTERRAANATLYTWPLKILKPTKCVIVYTVRARQNQRQHWPDVPVRSAAAGASLTSKFIKNWEVGEHTSSTKSNRFLRDAHFL